MLYESALIRKKALRLYEKGELFVSFMQSKNFFPYILPLKTPTQKELRLNFATLLDAIKKLQQLGLVLEYKEFAFKSMGVQSLPVRVVFESEIAFLAFIGKEEEFADFCRAYTKATELFPSLKELFLQKPKLLLENMHHLDTLLAIVRFFYENPSPNIYLRELPIIGVDTKFIQKNRAIVDALLMAVLDKSSYDSHITKLSESGFEKKYGLKYELPLVRMRILDKALYIYGLDDITVTTEEFCTLAIACENIFIVENKITMLSFPLVAKSIVLFGSGYGLGRLQDAEWMAEKNIYYWGDIDMDGFAILSQMRSYFCHTKSLFMDRETLEKFQDLAVASQEKSYKELEHLTKEEHLLYERLHSDYYGKNFRLEQERIPFTYIKEGLHAFR